MRTFVGILLLAHAACVPVEQVHLALGKTTDSLAVEWVVQGDVFGTPEVYWGTTPALGSRGTGDSREFKVDPGRVWYTFTATLAGLAEDTVYYYKVGDTVNGYSKVFHVTNRRARSEADPYRYMIMGDMGTRCAFSLCPACTQNNNTCDAATCATNKTTVGLISETATADTFLHTGDFAYDLDADNGTVGDQFFRNIEQLAAYTPYMVNHGNHEDNEMNIAHYMERFRLMPSNAEPAEYHTRNGATTNTMYFSYDHGLVHFISMSTEFWVGVTDLRTTLETFEKWVRADLKKANANRAAVPWIVMSGHRSIYCSCDVETDCDLGAVWVREFMEPILFEYGVDLFVNGHEHDYERTWPTYKRKSDQSNRDPRATIYITTGAAGSREMHDPFTKAKPSWSAFRSNSFGYSRMLVHNATHIHWQQVQTDPTFFPLADYGRVIDDTWIVQSQHGPFNESLAPQERPTSCHVDTCGEYDHWLPLLDIGDYTKVPGTSLITAYRKEHGEAAWVAKLDNLLSLVNSKAVEWEYVRGDGNSDNAWAGFKWKNGHA